MRMGDCKAELHSLLQEDVRRVISSQFLLLMGFQRLAGASLLIFANKQDIQGSLSSQEIRDVSSSEAVENIRMIADPRSQALDLPSIKSHNWKILPCSAVTGENLVTGLDWVVGDIANRIYYSATDGRSHGHVAQTPIGSGLFV